MVDRRPAKIAATEMSPRSETLERALGYPYAIPKRSFALAAGKLLDLGEVEVELSSRVAVLAYGSNAAPAVLARKLARSGDPVPVLRATLHGFEAVYSAHISTYGSIPATLRPRQATELSAFVAHLTGQQLELLSRTEPNYDLAAIEGGACVPAAAPPPASLWAYISRHGSLLHRGAEIAVEAIPARGRSLPTMSQLEVLELVRRLVCPGRSLEGFVATVVGQPEQARRWTQTLAKRRRASLASAP